MKQIRRRLRALEAAGQGGASIDHLLALARAGKLAAADLDRLSDEQLWWIVADDSIPMPAEAELDHVLKEVVGNHEQNA